MTFSEAMLFWSKYHLPQKQLPWLDLYIVFASNQSSGKKPVNAMTAEKLQQATVLYFSQVSFYEKPRC